MLQVLGRKTSNNVQKILWLLDELGIEYKQEDYGGPFGKTRTPEYLALNPNGTVPTLVDGELALWESNSIARYLASKYESVFYPAEIVQRAHIDKWMDWQLGTLSPAFRPLYVGIVRDGKTLDSLMDSHNKTGTLLRQLDATLAARPYIAGSHMTLADIAIGPMIYRWFTLDLADDDTLCLRHLLDRLALRPAFIKNIMISLA